MPTDPVLPRTATPIPSLGSAGVGYWSPAALGLSGTVIPPLTSYISPLLYVGGLNSFMFMLETTAAPVAGQNFFVRIHRPQDSTIILDADFSVALAGLTLQLLFWGAFSGSAGLDPGYVWWLMSIEIVNGFGLPALTVVAGRLWAGRR